MPDSQDVVSRLTNELNRFLGSRLGSGVSIDGGLSRLQGGFDTDTYALTITGASDDFPSNLVLRLFRHANEAMRVIRESTIQNAAAAGGHSVPRVLIDSTDEFLVNRPFFLMERLPGTSLETLLLTDESFIQKSPAIMAQLQARLHGLDTTKLQAHLQSVGIDIDHMKPTRLRDRIAAIAEAAKAPDLVELSIWLHDNYPTQPERLSICHGDFHPANILMNDGKVSGLIDWATTMFTHPEFDIAVTRTILSFGPPEDIGIPKEELDQMLKWFAAEYMAESRKSQDLDETLIDYYAVLRMTNAYAKVIGNRRNVDLPYVAHDGYAWDRPDMFTEVTRVVGETTGITLTTR